MSHFTDIETQISDVEALRDACKELGLELVENAEARGYFRSQSMRGQYVIRLKGPYDVALNKDKNGFYQITADLWEGRVEQEVGKGYGKLLQLYGAHKVMREARRKGYRVNRGANKQGHVVLTIGGAA